MTGVDTSDWLIRVHHEKNESARGKTHINGIERFWGYAKTRLSKFRGIPKKSFYLPLKECTK